jgi:HSP20 family protein
MYHPMESVRTLVDIDRLINSFFDHPGEAKQGNAGLSGYPLVDVRETDSGYFFEAALPGYDEKDVEVNIDGNSLTIESKSGQNTEKKDAEGSYLLRERYIESFSRSFKLPDNADPSQIDANFKNGLLTLEIKKRAESQKRAIAINSK